jgi:hypothetical protein
MNYEIKKCDFISGELWRCSFISWKKDTCRCSAILTEVEINSATRPDLDQMKKAALI